jgi:voltage-gated potassium channel
MASSSATIQIRSDSVRLRLLRRVEDALETPMIVLGLVWLALLILELTRGLPPVLEWMSLGIWVAFIFDFVLKLVIAPKKWAYVRRNWLTLLALAVPALRVFRVLRVARVATALRGARAVRGLRLVRVVSSLNRGMKALGAAMSRRGFGYVMALTVCVTFAGAAGMLALEQEHGNPMMQDYGTALWWTAMMMTTMGSEGWPVTGEGRVLCLLLAIYAFAVFGYVTATLATFFIGRDAERADTEIAGARELRLLRDEIAALRRQLQG